MKKILLAWDFFKILGQTDLKNDPSNQKELQDKRKNISQVCVQKKQMERIISIYLRTGAEPTKDKWGLFTLLKKKNYYIL